MGASTFRVLILLLFQVSTTFSAEASTVFGRYIGIFRHVNIKRDQVAKLDFILSREEGNTILLKAVLTLHFGDFKSGEYVAYHFDDVKYHLLTGTFVFDQPDQPITLIGKQSVPNEFTGDFRSVYSGQIGKLYLRSDKPVVPELPLIESVWGEYRGKCQSKVAGEAVETILQLHTYRSTEGASQIGNPFRAYKVKGFLGEKTDKGCIGGAAEFCIWGNVRNASYNFFENRLSVYNNYRNLSCIPQPDGLKCDACDFLKRVSDETAEPRTFSPLTSTSGFQISKPEGQPVFSGDIASIQGSYRGYVHHQYLDVYQPAQINILTYQEGAIENQKLRMSAVGTVYFGDFDGPESISYRFAERSYPIPLQVPQFIFDNSEPSADVDGILQVTSIGDGAVKGVWFSRLFGKVGDFELYKDRLPGLPENAKKMELVSGHYEGTEWALDVLVSLGTTQPNTENPFAPLTFDGWTILPGITGKIYITGGSFDFYTGRVGFEVGEHAVHLGQRVSRKKLLIKKMNYAVLAPLPSFPLQPHRLIGEPEGGG